MSFYQGKHILVTGASGFIGSHLTDALLASGAHVIGVDNFITGKRENLLSALTHPEFVFIEADASDTPMTYLHRLSNPSQIDCVFHLASPASPQGYQQHPVETYLVNAMGTHHLLQFLVERHPHARFLFTSTSESYGDPLEHPQKETYWGNVSPNGPRSMYDESKRLGEAICAVHQRSFGLDVRVVRIFNTYGPRLDLADGRVIPDFCRSLLQQTPLTIHGDGSQTRSFCYIDDLIQGLLRMMENNQAAGMTINLGNPHEITIRELAALFGSLASTPIKIEFKEKRIDDPNRRCPDITLAQQTLGWSPVVSLEEGIKKTLHSLPDGCLTKTAQEDNKRGCQEFAR